MTRLEALDRSDEVAREVEVGRPFRRIRDDEREAVAAARQNFLDSDRPLGRLIH
jgi:hypothetical protein